MWGIFMNEKYLFAHYLRGLAVLSVLFCHLGAAFFVDNAHLSSLINVPPIPEPSYPWITRELVPSDFPAFMGPFGVAVFFLISGFVIPISIEKYNLKKFLSKRFFRLYPTYVVVFTLNMIIALIGYFIYKNDIQEYPYSFFDVVTSYFIGLNTYIAGTRWLDPVAWTLGIEIAFYVVSVSFFKLFSLIFKRPTISIFDVIILGLLLHITSVFISHHSDIIFQKFNFINVGTFIKASYLMSFMLMGTSFFLYVKSRIKLNTLIYVLLWQYFSFMYTLMQLRPEHLYQPINNLMSWFAIAILVFSLAFSYNDKMKEHRIMAFLGDISYSLYLCHSYIGYFCLTIIINHGLMSRSAAVLFSAGISIIISYFIHKKIEIKSTKITFQNISNALNLNKFRRVNY